MSWCECENRLSLLPDCILESGLVCVVLASSPFCLLSACVSFTCTLFKSVSSRVSDLESYSRKGLI